MLSLPCEPTDMRTAMHHTNATALVGLSHRGSHVETMPHRGSRSGFYVAAAMRQPCGVFAVVENRNGTERVHYVLKDHLGSWTTITDARGRVEREQSFDAWGNMRDPDTWTGTVTQQPMFDRGYTGHEHLNTFGLMNMNGRMYDPVMSSFLSVDNYVQCPDFSQNFNRYAYCLNNPLKYTDPSGEELCTLAVVAIGAAVTVIMNGINNVRHGENFFHGAGPAAVTGGVTALFANAIGASAGVLARDIMGLGKSAAWANVAQAGFQIVSHGTMSGMSMMWRGGKFWHGFVSGATASVISGSVGLACVKFRVPEGWAKAAMIAGGALSGGVSAEMAGGDFIDGFCNGLISAGLNHALHFVADGGGKLIKTSLKEAERVKAIRQLGDLESDRNGAKMYEMMCKYADLEIVENYLLGSEGRKQNTLFSLQKNKNANVNAYKFYSDLSKNMGYNVFDANSYGLTEIAQSLSRGNPLILWTWEDCNGKLCNGHSLVVVGVEGYEGTTDFTLSVINTQNKVNNLYTTIKWNEIEYKQLVRFSLNY